MRVVTNTKDTNTSFKILSQPTKTKRQTMFIVLGIVVQLGRIVRGNFLAITSSLRGSCSESKRASFPSSTTLNRGVDPKFSNNDIKEFASNFFKPCKSHARDQWCRLNLLDTNREHNGQIRHHYGHEQSFLQTQPNTHSWVRNPHRFRFMLFSSILNK